MTADALARETFERILLVKPSAVGDVAHTVPLLVKLRARYPQARIDWLVTPENAPLVQHHPALSNVALFHRRDFAAVGRRWAAARGLVGLAAQLRRARYDLVIDMHGQLRTAVFVRATGARVRLGFDRPVPRKRSVSAHHQMSNLPRHGWSGAREGSWRAYTHRIPITTLDVHAIDRYLWAAAMLGCDTAPPDGRLYLSDTAVTQAESLLAPHNLGAFAALVPGTMWETKHWLPERFGELGQALAARGLGVVILGTHADRARAQVILERCPTAVDLCGQTGLGELTAVLRRATVAVTNDSGAMHLSVALGRPVVGIFGPTNPVHIGPYGHPESVMRVDLPCSPCNFRRLTQCPHDHRCMKDVTVAMALARVDAAFAAADSPLDAPVGNG